MRAERFISSRLDFRGRITVAATAVSFLVIILSLMVVDGFRREIRRGVSSLMGDVQLTASALSYYGEGEAITAADSLLSLLRSVRGVKSLSPAIYRSAVVNYDGNLQGVLVKGVPGLSDSSLCVGIPSSLAAKLKVGKGDFLPSYFIGDRVKVRRFRVADIYQDPIKTDDRYLVYASLEDMQRVNGWDSLKVSALEAVLSEKYSSPGWQRRKAEELSVLSSLAATASSDRYARLYDWLHLLDFNVIAILALMILVAGFNMVSGLLIMLFRSTGTIGTLKALGMGDRGVAGVFLRVASSVVLKGMAIGGGAALLFAAVQGTTHLIKLNPENYFVSFVPVDVNVLKILGACALAYILIMLILMLPSLFISKVDPANTVRVR